MNSFAKVAAVMLAAILTFTTLVPAQAARVFNFQTNRWEEATEVQARGRNYTPIPRTIVDYETDLAVGTIVVETGDKWLYLVLEDDKALRYGIGVGREGFEWSGTHRITRKAEWPGWTPPPAMRARQPELPAYMPGGPDNPLGARALYIGNTLYRLHGTSEPWTIGHAVSSGCIRLTNEDIIDLYDRTSVGARVIVRR